MPAMTVWITPEPALVRTAASASLAVLRAAVSMDSIEAPVPAVVTAAVRAETRTEASAGSTAIKAALRMFQRPRPAEAASVSNQETPADRSALIVASRSEKVVINEFPFRGLV